MRCGLSAVFCLLAAISACASPSSAQPIRELRSRGGLQYPYEFRGTVLLVKLGGRFVAVDSSNRAPGPDTCIDVIGMPSPLTAELTGRPVRVRAFAFDYYSLGDLVEGGLYIDELGKVCDGDIAFVVKELSPETSR